MQARFALLGGSADEQELARVLKDDVGDNLLVAEVLLGLASLDELGAGKNSCADWLGFAREPGWAQWIDDGPGKGHYALLCIQNPVLNRRCLGFAAHV